MNDLTARLIDAAAQSFPMRGPIYEFGFASVEPADHHSPPAGPEPAVAEPSTRIDRLDTLDRLPFPDGQARTVICHGALPYVFQPHRAIAEMTRILSPGGLLLVAESTAPATPGGHQRYWTFHPAAISQLLAELGATLIGWIGPDAAPHTVFGLGCKSPLPDDFAQAVQPFLDRLDRVLAETPPRAGVLRSLARRCMPRICRPALQCPRHDECRAQYAFHLPVDPRSTPAILNGCLPQTNPGTRLDLSE